LINDILDLSKIEAGFLKIELENTSAIEIARSVVKTLEPGAKLKGLELLLDVASGFPEHLYLDELRLKQVMLNLVQNAIKFTEQGHVKLKLKHEEEGDARMTLIVEVEDTGIGIAKEEQEMIFEYFQQSQNKASKKAGGTGLGLAITQKIVKLAGGSLQVNSEIGNGSVFQVVIPRVRVATIAELKKTTKIKNINLQSGTLLAVDDVDINLVLVKQYLKHQPIHVITTNDGFEAIELAATHKPNLILMDLRMPNISGQETARIIKANPYTANIPILAFTASILEENAEKLGNDFVGYITKPIKKNELLAHIQAYFS
jgi:signal transduction histidine kinase